MAGGEKKEGEREGGGREKSRREERNGKGRKKGKQRDKNNKQKGEEGKGPKRPEKAGSLPVLWIAYSQKDQGKVIVFPCSTRKGESSKLM